MSDSDETDSFEGTDCATHHYYKAFLAGLEREEYGEQQDNPQELQGKRDHVISPWLAYLPWLLFLGLRNPAPKGGGRETPG